MRRATGVLRGCVVVAPVALVLACLDDARVVGEVPVVEQPGEQPRTIYVARRSLPLDDGFEAGARYFVNATEGMGTVSVDHSVAYSGEHSLRLDKTGDATESFIVGYRCCTPEASVHEFTDGPRPVRLHAMVRADRGVPVQLALVCLDEEMAWIDGGQQYALGYARNDAWVEVENLYTCPDGARYISASVDHRGSAGSQLWLDDVEVQLIDYNPDLISTEPFTENRVELPGVNFAGTDVEWPENWELDYFANKGMRVFRVSMEWENLQSIEDINGSSPVYGPLSEDSTTTYYDFWDNDVQSNLDELDRLVARATELDAQIILNLHNYNRYDDELITDDGAALADFWRQLAARYRTEDHVLFGLMNEPGNSSLEWATHANTAISAIRDEGAEQPILVYFKEDPALLDAISDPADNLLWEVHYYIDEDGSGSHPECVHEYRYIELLSRETSLFRSRGARAFLGELGAGDVYRSTDHPDNVVCYNGIRSGLNYLSVNADVWRGFAWWSASHVWREFYRNGDTGFMHDLTPMRDDQPSPDGEDSIAMDVLEQFL